MRGAIRENWRVGLLVLLLVGSTAALFLPQATLVEADGEGGDGVTNLQYGIELDGGTRLSAPVVGVTATGVDFGGADAATVEREVAAAMGSGVESVDVTARSNAAEANTDPTVEAFANVTPEALGAALSEAGYGYEGVRDGVTDDTRTEMVDTVERKLSEAGLGGGSARIADTGEEFFIVVEAPDRDAGELRALLAGRGVVQLDAYYPNESGAYVNRTVLTRDQIRRVGLVEFQQSPSAANEGNWVVPVTVTDARAPGFADDMVEAGYDSGTTCRFEGYGSDANRGRCLLTILDDEVVYSASVTPGLGESFRDGGGFLQEPQFFITAPDRSAAESLRLNLRAGALPAPLDFGNAQVFSVNPALAERFKMNSLITAIVAVIAVSLVVGFRYEDLRVAAPMVVTALSEVLILLGFAAAVGYSLDLSVIAGFIAVIGTGVDDLVIIADEVLSEGDVTSNRVFRSRFRKAFWVIGAAAATTIIAMTPLAFLSLGALRGFAIVTILGVLVGVLITRPAYGNILRRLMTEQ
jgi:preprotein translocase subunit SecD